MNEYLKRYIIAVEHPEVSAFEHLEMLLMRDRLAEQEYTLNNDEKRRLKAADQTLLEHAAAFQAELARITSLESERQRRQPAPQRWWWYLDVLTALPRPAGTLPELALA
jgi:hypothetical protein